jgi:hypothetical protein
MFRDVLSTFDSCNVYKLHTMKIPRLCSYCPFLQVHYARLTIGIGLFEKAILRLTIVKMS